MASLAKQLQRDLKANPKKAGMLGVLTLVCAWFWGPLVFPKDDSKGKVAKPVAAATPAASAVATTSTAAPTKPAAGVLDWKLLAERMNGDRRMKAAVPSKPAQDDKQRNPFGGVKLPVPATDEVDDLVALAQSLGALDEPTVEEPAEQPQVSYEETWQTMPLVLSSTMVGARVRKAVINDRTYREGAAVAMLGDLEIRLRSVTPRGAVLVWNGLVRELRIPKPGETEPVAATTAATNEAANTLTEGAAADELEGLSSPNQAPL
ncbi:MAG: hypothetical protein JNK76_12280 [Planctomycetales bacterium]|nr:hypothetical protein [Planctomycetales bacterium]MBN8626117.1 hypothetical protein [Planctomycetota bacterium]